MKHSFVLGLHHFPNGTTNGQQPASPPPSPFPLPPHHRIWKLKLNDVYTSQLRLDNVLITLSFKRRSNVDFYQSPSHSRIPLGLIQTSDQMLSTSPQMSVGHEERGGGRTMVSQVSSCHVTTQEAERATAQEGPMTATHKKHR